MDQALLVTDRIAAGWQLVQRFNQYAKLQAAFWIKQCETGQWYLYLVSDQINDSNFDLAYGEVNRIVGTEPDGWLDPFEVKVAGVDKPIAKAVIDMQHGRPRTSLTSLGKTWLGNVVVDEVCIYPPVKS